MTFEVPSNLHSEFLAIGPVGIDALIEDCLGNSVEQNVERLMASGHSRPFSNWFAACVGSSRGDVEFVISSGGPKHRDVHSHTFERYRRGYRIGSTVELLGGVVMAGSGFYVILALWVASSPFASIDGTATGLAMLTMLAQALVIVAFGMLIKAIAHILFSVLDLAVASSPLLNVEQRTELLS